MAGEAFHRLRSITDAAAEATIFQRQASRGAADSALEAIKTTGMAVTELPPAEIARVRK
jgi:TRAP-type C4-dicarboxylate transport system substrate-binding protein